MKEFIKHNFFCQLSSQEDDKEEQDNLFQPRLEKIEEQLESRNLESSKFDDSLQHHRFNSGPWNYFIPKIDMWKFDGKDPITWIFQMEQLFDLHKVPTMQKVTIASLYLEPDQFVWYHVFVTIEMSLLSLGLYSLKNLLHIMGI